MSRNVVSGQQNLRDYSIPQVTVRLRLEEDYTLYSREPLDNPDKAVALAETLLRESDREIVCICNLDTYLRPINLNLCAVGGTTQSVVEIANIFKASILTANAAGILLFHSHPSGRTVPSQADMDITKRIAQAGALLGIPLHDHIIIGSGIDADPSYSIRDHYPELFQGVYDEHYIHQMLAESIKTDNVTEKDNKTASHGRSR